MLETVATLLATAKRAVSEIDGGLYEVFPDHFLRESFPCRGGNTGQWPKLSSPKAVDELNRERAKLTGVGTPGGAAAMVSRPQSVTDWGELSDVFLRETTRCFEWATAKANGVATNPLDPVKPGVEQFCPDVPQTVPAKATTDSRVYLASGIPDIPENAYGTESHLWRLPIPFLWFVLHKDEMYKDRDTLYCKTLFRSDLKDREFCRIVATAHPNVNGAADYAHGILDQLNSWAQ